MRKYITCIIHLTKTALHFKIELKISADKKERYERHNMNMKPIAVVVFNIV